MLNKIILFLKLKFQKVDRRNPTKSYKGISANCWKHPFAARDMCNRCGICIEEETGMVPGSITYVEEPNSGLLICNDCLAKYSDEELAEFYAMFSTKYWKTPVSKEVVLATLIKKPSNTLIKWYKEDGKLVSETMDLESGAFSKATYS